MSATVVGTTLRRSLHHFYRHDPGLCHRDRRRMTERPRGNRERLAGWLVDSGLGALARRRRPVQPDGLAAAKMTERHARKP